MLPSGVDTLTGMRASTLTSARELGSHKRADRFEEHEEDDNDSADGGVYYVLGPMLGASMCDVI